MYYDRKIKYLDYLQNGERVRGSGFVKLELRDGSLRLDVSVSGLHPTDTFVRDVMLCAEKGDAVIGRIEFIGGRGKCQYLFRDADDIAGTGIGYAEALGLRIPLGTGREIACIWREGAVSQPDSESFVGGRLGSEKTDSENFGNEKFADEESAKQRAVRKKFVNERLAGEKPAKERAVGKKFGNERFVDEEPANERTVRERLGNEGTGSKKFSDEELNGKRFGNEHFAVEGTVGESVNYEYSVAERDFGESTVNESPVDGSPVDERTVHERPVKERFNDEKNADERHGANELQSTSARGLNSRNSRGKKVMGLSEDKWSQLWAIYPHVHPFQDEREYLSIGPADFVLFPAASYKAVNNSFLLHGYYNYSHLILAQVEKKGEKLYYIGVPGSFFEKEKQVAIMFGFESFECAEEPAQAGDFGYYMMRTEL